MRCAWRAPLSGIGGHNIVRYRRNQRRHTAACGTTATHRPSFSKLNVREQTRLPKGELSWTLELCELEVLDHGRHRCLQIHSSALGAELGILVLPLFPAVCTSELPLFSWGDGLDEGSYALRDAASVPPTLLEDARRHLTTAPPSVPTTAEVMCRPSHKNDKVVHPAFDGREERHVAALCQAASTPHPRKKKLVVRGPIYNGRSPLLLVLLRLGCT